MRFVTPRLVFGCLALLSINGCEKPGVMVVVYTSVDQVFSEPVFRAFEERTKIRVQAVFDTEETKSTGVVNRIIAEANHPQADVFWSGDPMRAFLLIRRGLVDGYISGNSREVPADFKAPDGTWTGFAARARVLLVNDQLVPAGETPRSIKDLADPRWKGKATIANPLYGTTTMHIAALSATWGEDRARSFLNALKANGVRIASSNGEVRRLVAAGEAAFGLTDTDDANEALKEGAPVKVIYPDQDSMGTLVMPTAVVMIKGGPHPQTGRRLVDFLLSREVERRMAESAAHMPLRKGVQTPPGVKNVAEVRAMKVDYGKVAEEIEKIQPWLREWTGI